MYSKNSEGMETNNKTMHPFFSNTKRPRKNHPTVLKKVLYGTRHPMRQKDYMDSVDTNQPRHL